MKEGDIVLYGALAIGGYFLLKSLPSITQGITDQLLIPVSNDIGTNVQKSAINLSTGISDAATNLLSGIGTGAFALTAPGMVYYNWLSKVNSPAAQELAKDIYETPILGEIVTQTKNLNPVATTFQVIGSKISNWWGSLW